MKNNNELNAVANGNLNLNGICLSKFLQPPSAQLCSDKNQGAIKKELNSMANVNPMFLSKSVWPLSRQLCSDNY